MSWTKRAGALLFALLASWPVFAAAEAAGPEPEIWLVSYGPGEIYWQRFGHNAIWIRDPRLGLDHTFNFGFFDFEQEDFFLRFLQGRMLYFSAARPSRIEFAAYINENRGIRAQRLNLSPGAKRALTAYLLSEVRPENRDYLYDYYRNNCSTRVRDALDEALGGALGAHTRGVPAALNFRDHTRRLTHGDFWLYLGLEIVLGAPVDRTIDRWDEMFIPEKLAQAVGKLEAAGQPLVVEDAVLYASARAGPPETPGRWWPGYLLASLGVMLAAALLWRLMPAGLRPWLARTWLVAGGMAGLALLFFWFGTDHVVARENMNLLVFNPLWLLAAWKGKERTVSLLVAVASAAALVAPYLPPHQYTLDVLAAFLPLNLAAAAALRTKAPG